MYGGEKKEIGEAVNRGPCICHLLGSIVTPPFFPHNDAPFRHNYRHYSWRAFYRRHDTMGRYLYTLRFGLQPRWNMCIHLHARAHTYTRSSTSKFFEYCADPERKSSSFASILLCVLTPRFRVANTFEREPILSERVFPPPCENIGHSNSLSFLITRRFAIVSDRTEYRVTGTHHIMGLNK